jgi:hypothetical protein
MSGKTFICNQSFTTKTNICDIVPNDNCKQHVLVTSDSFKLQTSGCKQ